MQNLTKNSEKTDLIKAYIHNKQQLISTTTKHYREVS